MNKHVLASIAFCCGVFTGAMGLWMVMPYMEKSVDREAEACQYTCNLMGWQCNGFRYIEPERGHCWDCINNVKHMSPSARRVCGKGED